MKVFVTGATGYIGTELIRELLKMGHEIVGMFRDERKIRIPDHPNLSWVHADLFDMGQLKQCMKGCDALYHLAAYARAWSAETEVFYNINVQGTKNLLTAAEAVGIKIFIFTSTAGVLGPSGNHLGNESQTKTDRYFTEYERTKAIAEKLVMEYEKPGMHTLVLLPSRLYGPGLLNESNTVTRLIKQYMDGTWRFLPGTGKRIGNYVYVRDVIQGHIQALQFKGSGERFILGGTNINYRDFFNTVGKLSGKKRWLIPVPSFLILVFSYVLLWTAKMMKYNPPITPGWARKYLHDWKLCSQKAVDLLGYTITPLENGLAETIDWLVSDRS